MTPTHYQLLGVSPHASHEEIRRAYHRQALRHHPDANPDADPPPAPGRAPAATMAQINAAWEVLRDPERRRAYDRAIGTSPRPRPPGAPPAGWVGLDDEEDEADDLRHLWDDPAPRQSRPSDLLMMVPVILLVLAVTTFAFSAMSESAGLRTAALFLAPVTAGSFVAAPLFTMLRARSRNHSSS